MKRKPSTSRATLPFREAIAKATRPRFKLVLLAILVVAFVVFPGSVPIVSATPGVIHTVTGFSGASGIAFSPDGMYAYVTNRSSTTISKLDLTSDTPAIVDTIAVGSGPIGVAFTPDGTKAYVTNGSSQTISVVDTAEGVQVGTIPSGSNVFRVIFNSDGTRAYVGIDGTNQAQIIDATTDTEIERVSVSASSGGVALTPDEATLYVSAWSGGDVSLIDLSSNENRKQIAVGRGAMGVAAHPDGSKVYVSSSAGVSVISTETETVTKAVAGISGTYPLAIAPDGGEVYAATGSGTLYVVDTTSDTLVRTISTSGAYQLAVSPDCSRVITVSGSTATIVDTERDCSSKTVTFDSNEGSGSMSAQSGSSSASLTSNTFTRTGYTFAGWNDAADGEGTAYAEGATYDFSANLTLYAQWDVVVAASGSSSSSAGGDLVVVPVVPAAQGRVALEAPRRGGLLVRSAPAVIDREVRSDSSAATSEAVAMVGGVEVEVSALTRGSQFAQFATGNVSLDITVAEDHGVVDAVNGAPALKVARNSPASLIGAGLLPNSKLQVFLPASDGSFIEMPALEVNAEGAFEGSLTFGTSPRSKPMPIGQRFIQIVGLDEDGIETVLDIPVTIAQPLPAPEANRVNGERPVLELGQTLALNAGAPETVNVKRSLSATSVEGDGWVFTVETDAPDTTLDAMSFTRDAPVAFSGEGFMPGTRADVWLFSDPTLLGTVDIKEDGTFTALFAVDSAFVPTGNHTLQIQGVGDDGFVRAANLGVQVVDPLDSPVAPVGGQRFDLIPLAVMGTALLGLVVLTATVIAVGRRREPMTSPRPAI